jgi:hypothetical protein
VDCCQGGTFRGRLGLEIVETHAVRLGTQCVDFKSPGGRVRQLRTPIPSLLGYPVQGRGPMMLEATRSRGRDGLEFKPALGAIGESWALTPETG